GNDWKIRRGLILVRRVPLDEECMSVVLEMANGEASNLYNITSSRRVCECDRLRDLGDCVREAHLLEVDDVIVSMIEPIEGVFVDEIEWNDLLVSTSDHTVCDYSILAVATRPQKPIAVVEVDAELLFLLHFISVASAQPAESRLLGILSID
ncbi:hypothetical protein PMAYCL1PPCAC_32259, partial [Pristionchus mayeri]